MTDMITVPAGYRLAQGKLRSAGVARQMEGRQALLSALGRAGLDDAERTRLDRLAVQPWLSEHDIAALILARATPANGRKA